FPGRGRPVDHPDVEQVQPLEVERGVLHVHVDVVARRARQRARVLEREVAGVDADEGLALRELLDDGVEMYGALLRRGSRRRQKGDAEERGNEKYESAHRFLFSFLWAA